MEEILFARCVHILLKLLLHFVNASRLSVLLPPYVKRRSKQMNKKEWKKEKRLVNYLTPRTKTTAGAILRCFSLVSSTLRSVIHSFVNIRQTCVVGQCLKYLE
jgi:hypothetical protein